MESSDKLKTVIPLANALCRLAYIHHPSLQRPIFSILKFVKNHLRTTMTDDERFLTILWY